MAISRKFLQPINLLNASSDPSAAVKGDIYYNTSLDVVKYYDGSQWNEISGTGTTVSESVPTATSIGEGWFKSSTSELFIWDGTYWVEATSTIQGETLPDQTGNSGKFLSTDGSDTSWQTVDALPSQTGNSGKYLTTDGSIASWDDVDASTLGGQSGSYYTNYADNAAATAAASLVDSAPGTLDTLNELAAALGDDPNFATTVSSSIAGKQPLDADLTAISEILGTSGFLKKEAADTWSLDTNTYLTGNQSITLTGDVSGSGTTSISVTVADDSHNHIISNVDGLQAVVDSKAPLESPDLTGTPTAPTATSGTDTTQIATTAFVMAALSSAGGGATVSDSAPVSPSSGQLWYNSSNGRTFVYYNDGNTSQWVEVGTASTDPTGNYDAGMSNTIYGGITGIDGGGVS